MTWFNGPENFQKKFFSGMYNINKLLFDNDDIFCPFSVFQNFKLQFSLIIDKV